MFRLRSVGTLFASLVLVSAAVYAEEHTDPSKSDVVTAPQEAGKSQEQSTDKVLAVYHKELTDSYDVLQTHAKIADDDLKALEEHMTANPDNVTKENLSALAALKDLSARRQAIFNKANAEGRHLTHQEAEEIHGKAVVEASEHLLPSFNDVVRALSEAVIASHKELPEYASAHSEYLKESGMTGQKNPFKVPEDIHQSHASIEQHMVKAELALAAFKKALIGDSKVSAEQNEALALIEQVQKKREEALRDASKEEKHLSAQDIKTIHGGSSLNEAIALLPEHTDELKKLKSKLIKTQRDLGEVLELHYLAANQHEEMKDSRDAKEATLSQSHEKIKLHTRKADEALQALKDHVAKLGDNAKEEHKKALELLQALSEKRNKLMVVAEKEGRILTADEINSLLQDNERLHAAIGLLPEETMQESSLKEKIIETHGDLLDQTGAHADLQRSSVMKK